MSVAAIVSFNSLPWISATELSVDAFIADGNIYVRLHLIGEVQTFIRWPERRGDIAHLRLQAEHLNEVAQQLSLPEFRRYIADCGFIIQQ